MIDFGDNQNFYGTTKVGEKGQIVICKSAREYFDIKTGDFLVVIATKDKGISFLKTKDLKEFASFLENSIK